MVTELELIEGQPKPEDPPENETPIEGPETESAANQSYARAESNERHEVVITDIQMPFSSMFVFMVKWALAAIPALLLLTIIGYFLFAMLVGLMASVR